MFTTLTGEHLEKTATVCGLGSFGVVSTTSSAVPRLNLVAIKKLLSESSIAGTSAACEIDISNLVKGHPGCIQLLDVATREESIMLSPRLSDLHEGLVADVLYPIYEKATASLHDAIESHNFSLAELRSMMFQMASSLHFLHSRGIMHRDVKSNNFLYFADHTVKICDFGAAKRYHASEQSTPRISHAIFRAPEIFLNLNYDFKVDVWSLGCLFIYMLKKTYMYEELVEESNDNDVLNGIIHLLPYNIDIETYNKMIDKNRHFSMSSKPAPLFRKSWSEILNSNDENLISLINSMMQFNPDRRVSMSDVLSAPFFSSCIPIAMPPRKSSNFYLQINSCLERAQFITRLFPMHVVLNRYIWYNPRILFFALDIFDRILYALSGSNVENNPVPVYSNCIKTDGKILLRKSVSLFTYSCVYFALKYFYINKVQVEWSSFCQNKFTAESYLNFEKSFFYISSCSFYRINLYESFSNLTEYQIKSLMRFITLTTCNGETFYSYRSRAKKEIFDQ